MALTFVKRSALPVSSKGKGATPIVGITEMGQVQLGKICFDFMAGAKTAVVAFDGATMYIIRPNAKAVAKVPEQDHVKLMVPRKGGSAVFSGVEILRHMTEYGAAAKYDFKASGNQTFPAVTDEKSGWITVVLPAGGIPRRPVTHRVPRAGSSKANPGSTVAVAPEEAELVLDEVDAA